MYESVEWAGKNLKEWATLLNNQFTPGELYRMVSSGVRLDKMVAGDLVREDK